MKDKHLTVLFIGLTLVKTQYIKAQDKMPYKIFDRNGKESSYDKMCTAAVKNQVVLFGEYHDNSIIHWLELAVAKDISAKSKLVMGAEMLESDNQLQLNQYLAGAITQEQLDSTARLWPNYKTDYKPLVDFAKANKISFIATNVPRRYASKVYNGGFETLESLTIEEKKMMAPLPIAYDKSLPGYVKMVEEMGGHGGENLPKAQAIKDATMAWFISQNLLKNAVFLHFNGTYHSDNYDGIYWYLKRDNSNLKILTIATVSQAAIAKLEKGNHNKADFIIVTDEDVTKTY